MKSLVSGLALLSVTTIVASAPAQAQSGSLTRSFVSSSGVDSNPCTIAQPCATFTQAYTKVGANGIVAALDPGKYGPLSISGPVTINGNGWAAITGAAGSAAITVNASEGNVTLIGLEIDGAQVSNNGILVNSAGNLTITNCLVKDFLKGGISIVPAGSTTTAVISNTTSLNNGTNGIEIIPTASTGVRFSIAQTTASNNTHDGIHLDASASGTSITGAVTATHMDFNNGSGISGASNGAFNVYVLMKDSFVINNSNNGLFLQNIGQAVGPFSGAGVILDNIYFFNTGFDINFTGSSVFSFGNNYYFYSTSALTSATMR
jgi:hypothetical protein